MITRAQRQMIKELLDDNLATLEYHCWRLHAKVMQVDGDLDEEGALVVRAVTFVDWPPRQDQDPWGRPFGHMRVWGTLKHGRFFLHGYDAVTHVVQPRPLKIRYAAIECVERRGRPGRTPDPELIEHILQWMRGRLRAGEPPDALTEGKYVLYRWPDRYEPEDEPLEQEYALAALIFASNYKRKRSLESGERRLRLLLQGLYTWEKLKQLACDNP
jgi:hypothetical protein